MSQAPLLVLLAADAPLAPHCIARASAVSSELAGLVANALRSKEARVLPAAASLLLALCVSAGIGAS